MSRDLPLTSIWKAATFFPKTPNTHNLALLVKKGFKAFHMRTVRIALCEWRASPYARDSHTVMRIARSVPCEWFASLYARISLRSIRNLWFWTLHRFFGGEITLKDITELPPTQVCRRQTCIKPSDKAPSPQNQSGIPKGRANSENRFCRYSLVFCSLQVCGTQTCIKSFWGS